MENFQAIYDEAKAAGIKAEKDYIAQYGEPYYCGFAWVELHNGRSKFVNWLKKQGIGSKHWKKGWYIWRPTDCMTQSMDVLEAGAYAFTQVLRKYGIDAVSASRAD
jgi:hypothetical protein